MSPNSYEQSRAQIAETVVEILWRQWRVIGAAAAGEDARLAVDPEVLLLASLAMRRHEPRLETTMADWLEAGSTLISTQRLKNLARRFPSNADDSVRWVAAVSFERGRDHRWRRLAEDREGSATPPAGERSHRPKSVGPMLRSPPALMLRVRTAFGHGIKPDLLAVLHGTDFAEEIGTLLATLGYQRNPVHLALKDLLASGVVRSVPLPGGNGFTIARPLFPDAEIAPWGWWSEILGFLIAVVNLDTPGPSASDYARMVMLRRVVEPHLGDLAHARLLALDLRVPEEVSGERWMAFVQAVCDRAWWRERNGVGAGAHHVVPEGPEPAAVPGASE